MNEKENDAKRRAMISEDELNDVAGGSFTDAETKSDKYVRPINVFSFASSDDTPKFAIGETVMYIGHMFDPNSRAVITGRKSELEGMVCKEFAYYIRILEGDYAGETGCCFEHQLEKL